ncbi:hypothetical protein BDW74DRAFT_182783 [Aspergillus multicolor]|uniref:uncharacterized protein n=1 Tax=Aspergillus multicolor TaxID=41759 RepID=UPI003CCDD7BE
MTETHILDPIGEVTIVLTDPNAPLALLPRTPEAETANDAKREPASDITFLSSTIDDKVMKPSDSVRETETQGDNTSSSENPNEVRFKVSAAHLTLASSVFRHALTGDWVEGSELRTRGTAEIEATGWDTEAFLILLRIVHCKPYDLPKEVSLETLAKLALIADYYDCVKLVQWYADAWISKVASRGSSTNTHEEELRDKIIRLWIAWVFDVAKDFTSHSSCIMHSAKEPITSLGLPLPAAIIGEDYL